MVIWISLGLFIGIVTAIFTLVWWKVGDQWADEEYKKFGHGGGGKLRRLTQKFFQIVSLLIQSLVVCSML